MHYKYTGLNAIEAPRDLNFQRTAQAPTGQGRDILPDEVIIIDGPAPMPYYTEVKAPKVSKPRKTRAKATPKKKKAEPSPEPDQNTQPQLALNADAETGEVV